MIHYLRMRIRNISRSERGASAVEYGLLVALIAVIIIVGVTLLGGTLNDIFTDTSNSIDSGTSGT